MRIKTCKIPGCFELLPDVHCDHRGVFVKTFHEEIFSNYGLITSFAEEYYSGSHKKVLRGLHFQAPPMDHIKMVYCVQGSVLDVVVDLRVGSPTYGQFEAFQLSADLHNMIYIPRGLAHGFYVQSEYAIMLYKVTTVYSPEHDCGISWSSIGYSWPDSTPIISARDSDFIDLKDFKSPFRYEGSA
ncbi:dTDP-4-dehydrorhamnose 3,5-epimerase [Sporomusa malonica]|uniref:dTDP-4-dehydrorhamnose 3,5-epimerase n=1 Tax=Sporomusa malonica TaxID=112901 RepID=A0A1W1YS93_9FIRM|nr:dTDP-4-dehydrorhamnose 3,5-epimerase [Sporomusa malonica]SMC39080.1 dTDP-4-dehydrorhamnose 3,5-epimerase [Sporomusa malonica]